MLINCAVMWSNAADDAAVLEVAKRIIDRSVARAKELRMAHRFQYQNYSDISQEVFSGYGEENLKRLKEIGKKYDPEQVFQELQPGYFKL